MLKHYSEFLKKNIWRYVVGVIILLLVDLFQLVLPQVLSRFTDSLLAGSTVMSDIHRIVIIIGILAVGIAVSRFLWRVMITWTAVYFEAWIRSKLFKHLTGLPRTFYHEHKTGDLMAHATNDIRTVRFASSGGIIMSVDALFISITTIILMFITIDWKLTLIALAPMPLIAVVVFYMGRIIHRKFGLVQEGFSILSDKAQESFAGIRVIKSFSQEDNDLQDFNEKNQLNYERNMSLARTNSLMRPLVRFIGSISGILGIMFGTRFVLNGDISVGEFVAFITYLDMFVWPMMAFGFFTNLIQRGATSIRRLNKLFDQTSDLHDVEDSDDLTDRSIRVRDLTFHYPGTAQPALADFSLDVPSGSSLGIIGRTASGKSTLTSLLLRLYNIPDKTVFVGGQDINAISVADTRDMIGAVVQDHFLFSTKIKKNIAFTGDEIDEERMVESAKTAQIHDEIADLPLGYDTYLGERGVNLSGGQKQRTSIARLLYKSPDIMILDDALSAVDTKTEDAILRHIEEELSGRTTIVISHRVSTLRKMDQIIFMDQGRILERGSHEELMDLKGHYYQVFLKQQLEEKIQEVA